MPKTIEYAPPTEAEVRERIVSDGTGTRGDDPARAEAEAYAEKYYIDSALADLNSKSHDLPSDVTEVTIGGEVMGLMGNVGGQFETKDGKVISNNDLIRFAGAGHKAAELAGVEYDKDQARKRARINELQAEIDRLRQN